MRHGSEVLSPCRTTQATVVGLVGSLGEELDSLLGAVTLYWANQGETVLVRPILGFYIAPARTQCACS